MAIVIDYTILRQNGSIFQSKTGMSDSVTTGNAPTVISDGVYIPFCASSLLSVGCSPQSRAISTQLCCQGSEYFNTVGGRK